MTVNILGISAFYHDSAAALVRDGRIAAAAHEERFTRVKHDHSFPLKSIGFCLERGGITHADLDAVVFYDKPFLKFERFIETCYVTAPAGFKSFFTGASAWIKEKLFLKKLIFESLAGLNNFDKKKCNLLFSYHHLSHAASAFYPSPFDEAAILTVDGVGEWTTAGIHYGNGKEITALRELKFPHSVGLLYSAFTYYLGFKVNSGEYKLMGLAPYGDAASGNYRRFKDVIKSELVEVKDDGSIRMNLDYFDYHKGLKMADDEKWTALFGFGRREPEREPEQHHCDLALAIQTVTEEIVLKMAVTAKELTGSKYLCLAGGVALNCVANSRILEKKIFDDIWVQPAAGDAGGALGAALAAYHIHFDRERETSAGSDIMEGAFLGPAYDKESILKMAEKYGAQCEQHEDFDSLCGTVAGLLDKGNVIGWFQGRMEWGPRALGNRSILADARDNKMQRNLNLKIKFREGFRPFAPAVLYDDAHVYFSNARSSPYMLTIDYVKESKRTPIPSNYGDMPPKEKLYISRSEIPATTHVDFSARVQTVHKETNPRFWTLLRKFKEITGCPVIINTSFNVRGEPIVCAPEDAYKCFMVSGMDYLVIGDFLFDKKKQPRDAGKEFPRIEYSD